MPRCKSDRGAGQPLICLPATLGSPYSHRDVPEPIIDSAEALLKSRLGSNFFVAYFSCDNQSSLFVAARPDLRTQDGFDERLKQEHYLVAFNFRMPQHEFVDEHVSCAVLTDATVLSCGPIPDCMAEPKECQFPIDRDQARQIAIEQGLEPGLKEWEFSFHWNFGYQSYIWTVSNTLEETESGAEGRTAIIDSNTGHVYGVGGWVSSAL